MLIHSLQSLKYCDSQPMTDKADIFFFFYGNLDTKAPKFSTLLC